MKSSGTETGLLQKALIAFNRETELHLTVNAFRESHTRAAAAELELRPFGIRYRAEIKRWAQQTSENAIAAQLRRLQAPALLVADYVNPNMADRLRALGAQFIDAAGNAYLRGEGVYIFIRGNRLPLDVSSSRRTTRAFNTSGLRVIFNFLLAPKLVGATYRAISEVCGVSLGTVGWVLNDLKSLGYIHERSKKERSLAKPLELLDRWAEAYPEKLTPELEIGFFETPFELPWKELNLSAFDGCWSGEVGASLLDDYLSPAQGTVYLPRQMLKQLVVKYRLRKASEHLQGHSSVIRICEKFWGESTATQDRTPANSDTAPDILIYADLLASGDSRNLEAAERLYGKIKARLGID